jgi:hypothetical protein
MMGVIALENKNYDKAIFYFDDSLKLRPKNYYGQFFLLRLSLFKNGFL